MRTERPPLEGFFGTYGRLGLPISASDREIIRAARLKIAPHHRAARGKVREDRHKFYRTMLWHHHAGRQLAADFRL